MRTWNFDPTQYEARDFALIPEGDYRVTITDVTEKQYSTGNEGLQITFEVAGYTSNLWYHLILDPNDIQKTNQRIGMFFDSFGITNYNLSCYEDWVGKSGAVRVKHSAYNGKINATVPFCLSRSQQEKFVTKKEDSSCCETVVRQSDFETHRRKINQELNKGFVF